MAVIIYPNCNEVAAHSGPARAGLRRAAKALEARASAVLAAHRDTGGAKITTSRGSLDWFVNLEDNSANGGPAAAAIEFGHVARNGRFVPGIHALTGGIR